MLVDILFWIATNPGDDSKTEISGNHFNMLVCSKEKYATYYAIYGQLTSHWG